MSDIDKCISALIKLSKSFGIDAKALPPCFNHITVTFNKNYMMVLCTALTMLLSFVYWKTLTLVNFLNISNMYFFDKILEYFIECEKEAFNAEEFL